MRLSCECIILGLIRMRVVNRMSKFAEFLSQESQGLKTRSSVMKTMFGVASSNDTKGPKSGSVGSHTRAQPKVHRKDPAENIANEKAKE
jgi:hypothetical protein